MHSLTQTLLTRHEASPGAFEHAAASFSASDIRQAIAELVKRECIGLAQALSQAGLTLYPHSEDILAISALLAETQADWARAQALLEKLIEVQDKATTAAAWYHLIRVQRCHFEPAAALRSAQQACALHPQDALLAQELDAVREVVSRTNVFATPALAH